MKEYKLNSKGRAFFDKIASSKVFDNQCIPFINLMIFWIMATVF